VATEDDPWCLVLRPRGGEYRPFEDACAKVARMVRAWQTNPDPNAWQMLVERSSTQADPVLFEPTQEPARDCPAYRGLSRGHHRCAANDLPPTEIFTDYPRDEPGAATCAQCNWPGENRSQG
jgi:hypothetical protein